jgi:hypothetical protein
VSALYLYGVTRQRELPQQLADRGLFLVEHEGRAAIVSELDAAPVQANRHNLLAHADAVEELHEGGIVLPARFGTLLDDHDAALELLALPDIELLLERHRDNSELTLKEPTRRRSSRRCRARSSLYGRRTGARRRWKRGSRSARR